MALVKFHRTNAKPATPAADSTYFYKDPSDATKLVVGVAGTGGSLVSTYTKADYLALVNEQIALNDKITVVADIAARNAIASPATGREVFVVNASGDPTVKSGSAKYIYNNGAWVKTAESESMDLVLNWADIQGKPSVTPANIDTVVNRFLPVTNTAVLTQLGDSAGKLTYKGQPVVATVEWSATEW